MLLGDRKTAVLRGGAPWGFRLSGGVQAPVYITKVSRQMEAVASLLALASLLTLIDDLLFIPV